MMLMSTQENTTARPYAQATASNSMGSRNTISSTTAPNTAHGLILRLGTLAWLTWVASNTANGLILWLGRGGLVLRLDGGELILWLDREGLIL